MLGGRKDKIRPGDVLGALTAEAGGHVFTREQVGKITVTDQSTYIADDRSLAREAVRKLSAGKVKGKTVKVRALENGLLDRAGALRLLPGQRYLTRESQNVLEPFLRHGVA